MKVDFIIVGQGLAGTLLAHELLQSGKSIVVFDDPAQAKASAVAAGLVNPVVFRRMTKNRLADEAFTQLEITYRQLEKLLGESFWFPASIHRVLGENEAAFWNEKRAANQLEEFVGLAPEQHFSHPKLISPYGTGAVKKAGRLDLQKLIETFSGFLGNQGIFRNEKLETEKLKISSGKIQYDQLDAGKIIFCEGQGAAQNPFFRNLKFKSSKGEVLEVNMPGLDLNEPVSRDIFVLPVGGNRYKIGSTYQWDDLNTEITDSARRELLRKLKTLVQANPEILGQKAGIRPILHDRKPVIGLLPERPEIGIFNGLGPKGVLIGPYFARQFALFLTGQSALISPEANISRYFTKK